MKTHTISYQQTGYFSKLIIDYLNKEDKLKTFYQNFPDKKGFKKQIQQRLSFDEKKRKILVQEIEKQYQWLSIPQQVAENIQQLKNKTTFTVTTGHQLNLFTGPLYVIYKIVTTINLAKQLQQYFPEYNFIPVYWMATEDHDFEEINHFYYQNKRIDWKIESKGAVGRIKTEALKQVFETFVKQTGTSKNAKALQKLFQEAYCNHPNLAKATRFLVNHLFGNEGLLIIDGDTKKLKQQFSQVVKNELITQNMYTNVHETSLELKKKYKTQVNPREINLFYLTDTIRERIIFENKKYKINHSSLSFTKDEILKELELYPERFSPNVIMRPLYQETILPNLSYIGGGGELAYWFQLKASFDKQKIPFPILLLRNSVLLATKQQLKKAKKLSISINDLFLKQHNLEKKKVKELSNINIDFTTQKKYLLQQFTSLKEIAKQTDKSFLGAVNAQEKKQLKGLQNLEKRLLKAQKRRLKDELDRTKELQNQLFPNQGLQERYCNFSEFYKEIGAELITTLLLQLKPLQQQFLILEM